MEFRGLLRHATRVHVLDSPAGWSRSGFLGGYEIAMAANGAGAGRAAAAVDAALAGFAPDAIVSVGFCGALDPTLSIADIVAGATIFSGGRAFEAQSPVAAAPHRRGTICSIDYVARTAAGKSELPRDRRHRRRNGGRRSGAARPSPRVALLLHQDRHRPGGRDHGQ